MSFIKSLYVISIALLVFAFVVFGIAAVPVPQSPEVPPELASVGQYPTEEQQQLLTEQSQQQQAFQEQVSVYNQVISFVIIGVAVALLAGSILWLREMPLIGEGVTLGAVFTLLYGLYFAYSINAGLLSFVAVVVGLVILLGLIYRRFVSSTGESGWMPKYGQPHPGEEDREPVAIAGKQD